MLKHIAIAFGILLAALALAGASPTSGTEKPAIPDDLRFELKTVPAGENGIILWRRAAAVKVPLNDQQKTAIKYCWTPGARPPSAEDLSSLQGWYKRNGEALELFNASLAKPKAQWPERDPQNEQPELGTFVLLAKARLFAADQLAESQKFEAAAQMLEGNLKLAKMGLDGDPLLIQYLIACTVRSQTHDAILRLAGRVQTPLPVLAELLTNLPALDSETNLYARILRAEFTRDYNDNLDTKKLAERMSKMSGTNAAIYLSFYPDELQRAFRVLLDPSLVPLHPKPYDANAEIVKSIRHYRIYRENTLVPWMERDGSVELDSEMARTNLVADIAPLMELVKDEPLPLSHQAVQRARAAYLKIENPIGRIFDTDVLGFMASDLKVCQARTERGAVRACLAAIIFERRKGRLPASLEDLVAEKILPAVPVDQFSGEPLHYSREKRKIWSVSDNGVDDGGQAGKTRWYEKDAVWQIPESK